MADRGARIAWGLALGKLAIGLAVAPGYGYFRDEFYYLACADHLDFGYVDHPPLSVWILAAWRSLFGDSVFAIRVVPALLGALRVLVAGRLAAALGGGLLAQSLGMVAVFVMPVGLALDHFYSMNALDMLLWPVAALCLLEALGQGGRRRWLALGAVLGLGLLNKISVLWLGFGFGIGLLLTSARARLAESGPWLAAAIALAIFAPYLLWQVGHDWPTLAFIEGATGEKMRAVAPVEFLSGQALAMHPASVVLALAGLWLLMFRPPKPAARVLGWTYLAVFGLLITSGSARSGYLVPAYGWVLPAGAVAVEGWLGDRLPRARWGLVALLAAAGAALAPLAIPVLPVRGYLRYARALGVQPSTAENKAVAELPQHYADMHGWPEIVDAVERAWQRVPERERSDAVVFTHNYGVAGAVDLFGRSRGLPPAVSGHNNYWLWGTAGRSGRTALVVGGSRDDLAPLFESVEVGATIDCGLCMPYENGQTVWVARGLRGGDLAQRWERVRHYD